MKKYAIFIGLICVVCFAVVSRMAINSPAVHEPEDSMSTVSGNNETPVARAVPEKTQEPDFKEEPVDVQTMEMPASSTLGNNIVKGALPPKLESISQELAALSLQMSQDENELKSSVDELTAQEPEIDRLIADADRIIEEISRESGIDPEAVEAERQKELLVLSEEPSPETRHLNDEMDTIEDDLSDIKTKLNALLQ